jgi:hypothetical protein
MSLFRKRGTKFPEQNPAVLGLFSPLLEPSKSVYENNWFSERMTGGYNSGRPDRRPPLPKLGGQLSHGEAFLFRMTVLVAVFGTAKVCRQTAQNEK